MSRGGPFSVVLLAMALAVPAWGADTLEVDIAGRWRADEDGLLIEFRRDNDSLWNGLVVGAAHEADIGQQVFSALVFRSNENVFFGWAKLPTQKRKLEVTITVSGNTMKAVIHRFLISKTIELTRVK